MLELIFISASKRGPSKTYIELEWPSEMWYHNFRWTVLQRCSNSSKLNITYMDILAANSYNSTTCHLRCMYKPSIFSCRTAEWMIFPYVFTAIYMSRIVYIRWGLVPAFSIFNSAAVEVLECISNEILHLARHVINYPCWNWFSSVLAKGAPVRRTSSSNGPVKCGIKLLIHS